MDNYILCFYVIHNEGTNFYTTYKCTGISNKNGQVPNSGFKIIQKECKTLGNLGPLFSKCAMVIL